MEYVPNQVSGKGMGIPNLTGVTQKGCLCVCGGGRDAEEKQEWKTDLTSQNTI